MGWPGRASERRNSPSVQPDTPRFVTVSGERAVRRLECPKEERVVGMSLSLDGNISGPVAGQGPCNVGKAVSHLEVCAEDIA